MSAAPETATRSCKGCANFQWAGESKAAVASYDDHKARWAAYCEELNPPDPKTFWGKVGRFLEFIGPSFQYAPLPPFPQLNPEHYGWCRLRPTTVEKGVNEWCSHHAPSHGREATE